MFNTVGILWLSALVAGHLYRTYYTNMNERNDREAQRVADEQDGTPGPRNEVIMTLETMSSSQHRYIQLVDANGLMSFGSSCTVRIIVHNYYSDNLVIPDHLLTSAFGTSRGTWHTIYELQGTYLNIYSSLVCILRAMVINGRSITTTFLTSRSHHDTLEKMGILDWNFSNSIVAVTVLEEYIIPERQISVTGPLHEIMSFGVYLLNNDIPSYERVTGPGLVLAPVPNYEYE